RLRDQDTSRVRTGTGSDGVLAPVQYHLRIPRQIIRGREKPGVPRDTAHAKSRRIVNSSAKDLAPQLVIAAEFGTEIIVLTSYVLSGCDFICSCLIFNYHSTRD